MRIIFFFDDATCQSSSDLLNVPFTHKLNPAPSPFPWLPTRDTTYNILSPMRQYSAHYSIQVLQCTKNVCFIAFRSFAISTGREKQCSRFFLLLLQIRFYILCCVFHMVCVCFGVPAPRCPPPNHPLKVCISGIYAVIAIGTIF